MKTQKLIRYGVLFLGVGLNSIILIKYLIARLRFGQAFRFVGDNALINDLVGIGDCLIAVVWGLLSYLFYFFITKMTKSLIVLLLPAIFLFPIHSYLIMTYLTSTSSTSGIIMSCVPIYGGIAVAIGFFFGAVIEKIRTSKNSQKGKP